MVVFFPPLRTPNTWPGWPLWAPNFCKYSPLSQRESNYHVLAKNRPFWVKFGGVCHPQGPQCLTRMATVGSKFSLILLPESKGIKSTCLCSQRVKWSCFSQKTAILNQLWGCFPPPQDPQYLTRMATVGSKFSLILLPESKGIKSTYFCSQRVKLSCFNQKTVILIQIWGCFPPPRAPNNWPGLPLWAPNFP